MSLLFTAESVANEIVRRMELITVALGAETDCGVKVYQGRRYIEDSMIPCSVLIEGDDVPERVSQRTDYQIGQRYVLQAYVPCDPDNPNTAAHQALRDLKKAMFRNADGKKDWTFSDKVKLVEYLGRDIGPRADGAAFVVAIIEINVKYVENVAEP